MQMKQCFSPPPIPILKNKPNLEQIRLWVNQIVFEVTQNHFYVNQYELKMTQSQI